MLESPFCGHVFSETETTYNETIKCECGKTYRSKDLIRFNHLNSVIARANADIGVLVKSMAEFNTSQTQGAPAVAAYEPPPTPVVQKPVKPPKPKRERRGA